MARDRSQLTPLDEFDDCVKEGLGHAAPDDPVAGKIHAAGKMIKLSRTPMVVGPAPSVGEHTEEVLTAILGYSAERVQSLIGEGVLRSQTPS